MDHLFIGVDVGTGSVRAGCFNAQGHLMAKGEAPIQTWRPAPDFVEQSSEDIWEATGRGIRRCLTAGKIDLKAIKGISFDATCSLVALGENFTPITVSPTGKVNQNIIVWMDHRANPQALAINRAGHEVLRYVGGVISPEMEPPKLMWLKQNLKDTWAGAKKFMDLADYMVYRASGRDCRSLCTTVCKWTYLGHYGNAGTYDLDFFKQNDLLDIFENNRVPMVARPIGELAGELTTQAADELGLISGIPVGVGIIDAHAGGIGSLGPALSEERSTVNAFNQAMALIAGTSSCHMAVSQEPRFINGVWGPYWGAMIPDMWLNEGGQSATGSFIDLTIKNNAEYQHLLEAAAAEDRDIYTHLNHLLEQIKAETGLEKFKNKHLLPYHHGNRSPRADPEARGAATGLTLNTGPEEIALWYGVAIQAVAYGTRHILEAMNDKGYHCCPK